MQHPRRRPIVARYEIFLWSLVACSNFEPGLLDHASGGDGGGIGVAGFSFNGAQSGQGGRSESSSANGSGLRPPVTREPDDQGDGDDSSSAGGADGGGGGAGDGSSGAPDGDAGATGGAGGSSGDGTGAGGMGGASTSGASGTSGGASAGGGTAGSLGGRGGSSGGRGGSGGTSGGRGGGSSGGRGGNTSSGGRGGSGSGSSGGSGAASGAGGHGSSGAGGHGPPPPRDLILSEYVEGSGNFKAVEIRSETATDLAGCELVTYSNGNVTTTRVATLDGSVAAGDVQVLCTAGLNFNGNDAIALECEGVTLDVLGQIGFDPKDAWVSADVSTLNHTLRRRCAAEADPDGSDVFDPAAQWLALPTDTFDGLGDPACE